MKEERKRMEVHQLHPCLRKERRCSGVKRKVKFVDEEEIEMDPGLSNNKSVSKFTTHDLSNPVFKKRVSSDSTNSLHEFHQKDSIFKGQEEQHMSFSGCRFKHNQNHGGDVDLPWVAITSNDKVVKGKLFSYERGNDVKIVCFCHMTKMSPSEFVKHAGCSDLTHPERSIVVIPPGRQII